MTTRRRVVIEAPRKRKAGPKLESIRVLVVPDDDPDTSYLDQDEFEDERKAYRRGDWFFVGMYAEAEVVIDNVVQTLRSGGLWGIQSDSDKDHFEEVAGEEYDQLREILVSIGVATRELPVVVDPRWIAWRV